MVTRSEDVYPRRNLPEVAENWGRTVERRQVAAEKAIEGLGGTLGNQGRSSAGSLSVLGRQIDELTNQQNQLQTQQVTLSNTVDDLSGRTAFMGNPNLSSYTFNTAATHVIPNTNLSFTLSERRVVKIQMNATMSVSHQSAGGTAIGTVILYQGSTAVPATLSTRPQLVASVNNKNPSMTATGFALLDLPAGSHTFSTRLEVQLPGATGSVSVGGVYLLADVFQKL